MNKYILVALILSSGVSNIVAGDGGNVGGGGGGGGVSGCGSVRKAFYAMLVPSATAASDCFNGSGADTSDFSTVLRELDRLSNFVK